MGVQDIVADGHLLVAVLISLLAGLISFASPCVLPLVPGYLAYVGGIAGSDDRGGRGRGTIGALLFVAGFTVVFVAFFGLLGSLGAWLFEWQDLIVRVMGVALVVMGLIFMGMFGALQRTVRVKLKPRVGLLGAPLLGIVFGLGWAPCMGPTLAMIGMLAFEQGSAPRATLLAICYSIGLGLPFVLIAFGFGWMTRVTGFLRRHIRLINIVGGGLMIVIGLLMVSGLWNMLMAELQVVIGGYETPL